MIVVCNHPLPLCACMLHFDLVDVYLKHIQHSTYNKFEGISRISVTELHLRWDMYVTLWQVTIDHVTP